MENLGNCGFSLCREIKLGFDSSGRKEEILNEKVEEVDEGGSWLGLG